MRVVVISRLRFFSSVRETRTESINSTSVPSGLTSPRQRIDMVIQPKKKAE